VTSEVLRSAGYNVLTARNASDALTAYGQHPNEVDLLLTDVILPGENGHTLAKRLHRGDPGLSVLFITGYADQMEGRETGHAEDHAGDHADHLAKPFSTSVLLQKVREMLERRHWASRAETKFRHASGSA
jgi:CheY-like chemotaxis protein